MTPEAAKRTPFDDGALYDLFFDRCDYGLEYYLGLARAEGAPVLDLACGTGRVLLPLLQAGLDTDGVDLFEPMLARLREKAAALGLKPKLSQASMSEFALSRRYRLIIVPFNAFVHNLTTAEQLAALERCREHLVPGGLLAFDTAFPGAAWITAPDGVREMEMEIPHPVTKLPVRMYDTRRFDRVRQLQYSECEIQMLNAAGEVAASHLSQTTIRWIYQGEMELLLRVAGFAEWKIWGGFDRRPLSLETDPMIVEARTSRESRG